MLTYTEDTSSLVKRPFDLQEAVVLLDVYLNTVKQGRSVTQAAETASLRLRSLAKRRGYNISDSYRSVEGLFNRLRSIGGLYEGQESKSAPGTTMFAEAVSLFKNDRARYDEILGAENWIKYDFTNAKSFERTVPAYCAIAGAPIEGKS